MAKRLLTIENTTEPQTSASRYLAGVLIDDSKIEVWGLFKNYLIVGSGFNPAYARLFLDSRDGDFQLNELSEVFSYQDGEKSGRKVVVTNMVSDETMAKIREAVPEGERVVLENPYDFKN